MVWGGFVYTGALSYASRHDEAALADMRVRAAQHVDRLASLLKTL